MQSDQLTTKQVLARCDTSGDCDGLLALICDQAVDTPISAVERVLGNLGFGSQFQVADIWECAQKRTLNHPFPTPVSVFASVTFFMYAMTGPL